jgi:MYXO-CTERM domain-containing protein
VKGLSTQIVDEIECIKPGSFDRIDNIPKASLGAAVFPFLQTPAKKALAAAIAARSATMTINSAFRTVAQQYLLYAWYKSGRCGIGLAATPGTSNHEQGLAVDIQDNGGWNSHLSKQGFKWLGSSDPVHFDYAGGGTVNWSGLDVEAFQRLWNRNHPSDTIAVDGDYGPDTEKRLVKSPIGGFPIGAVCNDKPDGGDPPPDPKPDSGTVKPPPVTGDMPPEEPEPEIQTPPQAGGCSSSPSHPSLGGALLALLLIAAGRRR